MSWRKTVERRRVCVCVCVCGSDGFAVDGGRSIYIYGRVIALTFARRELRGVVFAVLA